MEATTGHVRLNTLLFTITVIIVISILEEIYISNQNGLYLL